MAIVEMNSDGRIISEHVRSRDVFDYEVEAHMHASELTSRSNMHIIPLCKETYITPRSTN